MNQWVGIGRLTKSPEKGGTQGGTVVTKFTLAVDKQKKSDGADFFNVKTFGKLAENCAQYLDKGRQVAVFGTMTSHSYTKEGGQRVTLWECIAQNVQFLGGGESRPQHTETPRPYGDDPFADTPEETVDDSDLPF